jgi:hypothetical protein
MHRQDEQKTSCWKIHIRMSLHQQFKGDSIHQELHIRMSLHRRIFTHAANIPIRSVPLWHFQTKTQKSCNSSSITDILWKEDLHLTYKMKKGPWIVGEARACWQKNGELIVKGNELCWVEKYTNAQQSKKITTLKLNLESAVHFCIFKRKHQNKLHKLYTQTCH